MGLGLFRFAHGVVLQPNMLSASFLQRGEAHDNPAQRLSPLKAAIRSVGRMSRDSIKQMLSSSICADSLLFFGFVVRLLLFLLASGVLDGYFGHR